MKSILTPSIRTSLLLTLLVLFAAGGCTAPQLLPVWRPWTRTIGDTKQLTPGPYSLTIEGEDGVTVGKDEPVHEELKRMVDDILSRRGFVRSDGDAGYAVTLRYRVGAQSSSRSTTLMSNRTGASSFWTGLALANASSRKKSLGVAIAALVGMAASSANSSTVMQTTTPETQYEFSIALIMSGSGKEPLWQGDAVWSSEGLDVIAEARLPLHLLASELPTGDIRPEVRRVKEDRAETFYDLYVKDRWFSSPAVPYRIRLESTSFRDPVEDKSAYAAILDLLENAEISVPVNFRFGEDDYSDVADPYVWRKILLGGEYLLGPLKEETRILVSLESNAGGGYNVTDARIATSEEYSAYQSRLAGWRAALAEYYAVFD